MSGGASDVVDHAKNTLSDVASQAGGKVTQQIDSERDRAASSLGSIAQALRDTSDQIRQQNENATLPVHQYVASAADQVERFSGYLRSTDARQMMSDVEQFARRQPGLFLGSAFLLGLLGARFLKSSGQNTYSGARAYGSGGYGDDNSAGRGSYDTAGAGRYGGTGSSTYGTSGQGSYGSSSGQGSYGSSSAQGTSYGSTSGQGTYGSSTGQGSYGSTSSQGSSMQPSQGAGSSGVGQEGYRSGDSGSTQAGSSGTRTGSGKATGEI